MSEILSPEKIASHLFQKWSAELRNKDRKFGSAGSNYEELFFDMYKSDVPFEIAHTYLKQAINKHLPNIAVAKFTWAKVKGMPENAGLSFNEWMDNWKRGLEDVGTEAFYSIYSPPAEKTEEAASEEKTHGNMSKKEYRLQRRYAESFPILNTDALVKNYKDNVDNYDDYFEGLAQNVLEKKNDNN